MFLDDIDDLLRPSTNLVLLPAFEHHSEKRLGARVANEEPPLTGDARFDARDDLGDRRYSLQRHSLTHHRSHHRGFNHSPARPPRVLVAWQTRIARLFGQELT